MKVRNGSLGPITIDKTLLYSASSPLIQERVEGKIVAENNHTCVLRVTKCHQKDEVAVQELQGVLVVKYETLKVIEDK